MEDKKQNFILPLKTEEFLRLKKGKDVIKFYHMPLEPLPMFVVCLSKREIPKKDWKPIIENGDNAIPIKVTDEELDKLKNPPKGGYVLRAEYQDFRLLVLSEEEYKRGDEKRKSAPPYV